MYLSLQNVLNRATLKKVLNLRKRVIETKIKKHLKYKIKKQYFFYNNIYKSNKS